MSATRTQAFVWTRRPATARTLTAQRHDEMTRLAGLAARAARRDRQLPARPLAAPDVAQRDRRLALRQLPSPPRAALAEVDRRGPLQAVVHASRREVAGHVDGR